MSTALVTGTSSGIGLATAVSLARAGHLVAATMRNLDRAGDLRKIAADEQLPIDIAALDVDDDASVREAFATIAARHGPSTSSSTTPAFRAAARSRRRRSVPFAR